ncbi:lipase 3-like isoform X2 [Diabrotica virgifera virgifera]|uniref:AB hydrolase-1 domain-containing protein n=1 Tax=Diabrotica virgifera virgifera TaxID=50390 RepID=A0ABM5L748_DIAVI|nr:lipase 3-like isoform X2 [Diabrotica virgifera virgifera]
MLKRLIIIFSTLHLNILNSEAFDFQFHPDSRLSITQILTKYGYPVEIHNVITEDDYIITVFRIPHGKNSTKTHKYPVILVPGTCGCSENFIGAGIDHAIGYFLSDRGFDVWLTNTRGNLHAQKHKTMDPERDRKFWNFGWHEVAIYDTTALVDYILNATKASQAFYIGHSQGTTSYFAWLAEKPEYNEKIKLAVHLGPSVIYTNVRSPVAVMGKHASLIEKNVQVLLQTFPAGCSVKELLHYFQIIHSGSFTKYDYGAKGNMKKYGTYTPPLYNLSNILAPVSLFVAHGDNVVPWEGVRDFITMLPNIDSVFDIPIESFNHVDYIFSNITTQYVNEPVYQLFMKHLQNKKT